jgi:hypothetical protein
VTRSNLLEFGIETSNLAKISMVLPTGIKFGQFSSNRDGNIPSNCDRLPNQLEMVFWQIGFRYKGGIFSWVY